jgi:diguanylate cyclase (GGDEF)-like protein/PAS domain S-box-containing protein
MSNSQNQTNQSQAKNRRLTQSASAFNTISERKSRLNQGAASASSVGALKNLNRIKKLEVEVELLTQYSSDTVYRLDYRTMKYDYISPAVTKLLGFGVEEIKKINFRSLIVETKIVTDGLKKVFSFEELETKRKAGDVSKWQADYLIRCKDGSKIWVSDVSHPWFDESGRIIGSVGSLRDITDRVEAEAKIRTQIEQLANTDSLTGLPNRNEFFNQLETELKRIKRNGSGVAVLVVDVDNFKNLNTLHGFDFGDKILGFVAEKTKLCLRDTDVLTRVGGTEFAAILPDTDVKGAYFAAERIRKLILEEAVATGDAKTVNIAVSVGVSAANFADQTDATKLYKLADTRLYIAKNSGKNQVALDDVLGVH